MHWLIAIIINLALLAVPATEPTKTAQAWDAKSIIWQKTDADGTKWAVLEGRSDVPGEAFTYAAFVPAGFHDFHSHGSDARVAVVQGVFEGQLRRNTRPGSPQILRGRELPLCSSRGEAHHAA